MSEEKKDSVSLIRREILLWNQKYPIDLHWRKKYRVAFGSKAHLEVSFIDMKIDLEEEEMLNEARRLYNKKDSGEDEIDEILNIPKVEKMSAKEIDNEFDNLDINEFYKKSSSEDEITKL